MVEITQYLEGIELSQSELLDRSKNLISAHSTIIMSYFFGSLMMIISVVIILDGSFKNVDSQYLLLGIIGLFLVGYGLIRSRILREAILRFRTTVARVDNLITEHRYGSGKTYYGYYNYEIDGRIYKKKEALTNDYYLYLFSHTYAKALVIYDPMKPGRSVLAHKVIPGYNPIEEMEELDHPPKLRPTSSRNDRAKRYFELLSQNKGSI